MTDEEIIKKKRRLKPISEKDGQRPPGSTFPILAHIVLSNGSRVDIPRLPTCTSELTTYDHLRIGLGHAAIAISWVREQDSRSVPKLMLSSDWDVIRLNLEDLLNHLHYAIEGFHPPSDAA